MSTKRYCYPKIQLPKDTPTKRFCCQKILLPKDTATKRYHYQKIPVPKGKWPSFSHLMCFNYCRVLLQHINQSFVSSFCNTANFLCRNIDIPGAEAMRPHKYICCIQSWACDNSFATTWLLRQVKLRKMFNPRVSK